MEKPVKLKEIMDGMDLQFDEFRTFLNIKKGEVITVSQEALRLAEDEEPTDHLPEWQQNDIRAAIDVVENFDDYIDLPDRYEINEYEMMEDFCYTLTSQRDQDSLLDAIRGKGAFRRFKDLVGYIGIEKKWYAFRDDRYKQVAIDWCDAHNVKYVE